MKRCVNPSRYLFSLMYELEVGDVFAEDPLRETERTKLEIRRKSFHESLWSNDWLEKTTQFSIHLFGFVSQESSLFSLIRSKNSRMTLLIEKKKEKRNSFVIRTEYYFQFHVRLVQQILDIIFELLHNRVVVVRLQRQHVGSIDTSIKLSFSAVPWALESRVPTEWSIAIGRRIFVIWE